MAGIKMFFSCSSGVYSLCVSNTLKALCISTPGLLIVNSGKTRCAKNEDHVILKWYI